MDRRTHKPRLLEVLGDLAATLPDMRFGQLVCGVCSTAGKGAPGDLYDIEDDELLAAAEELLRQRRLDLNDAKG